MRTCTVMIYTDGTTTRYAVMRGPMRGKTFDSNAATTIAVYELTGAKPDYVAITALTRDAPGPSCPVAVSRALQASALRSRSALHKSAR
jgi:hypothetical protein